jgi:hypothetical protein
MKLLCSRYAYALRKVPAGVNSNAVRVARLATGESDPPKPKPKKKNPDAVALGKLGASKGGKARAIALSSKERSEIARKAAEKRRGHAE